jgi:hypothetical protein
VRFLLPRPFLLEVGTLKRRWRVTQNWCRADAILSSLTARKEKALLGYEEDRRLRAEKDERGASLLLASLLFPFLLLFAFLPDPYFDGASISGLLY